MIEAKPTTRMKEHPILFSGPMVRAILEGRKTQTRRVVEPQSPTSSGLTHFKGCLCFESDTEAIEECCPYGAPGDRLWVREAHALKEVNPHGYAECLIHYQADNSVLICGPASDDFPRPLAEDESVIEMTPKRYRPSIHMHRWASRITLELVSVRLERLQDITPDDCRAEGMPRDNSDLGVCYNFGQLWNSLNQKRGLGWDVNPWVWVLEFNPLLYKTDGIGNYITPVEVSAK